MIEKNLLRVTGNRICSESCVIFKYHMTTQIPISTSTCIAMSPSEYTSVPVVKSLTMATVLNVKHYPAEELVILLHGTPAVITLQDFKMYVPDISEDEAKAQWPSMAIYNKAPCVEDICEGAELILVDCGTWNVYKASMCGARVMLSGEGVRTNAVCAGTTVPVAVILPARRKRSSMQ